MTAATLGLFNVTVDGTNLEEVIGFSGFGETNDLIEVTNWDSPTGTKEHIGGLADGQEVTVTCNYIHDAAQQQAVVASVQAKTTLAWVVTYNTLDATYTFDAASIGYAINPGIDTQNQIEFTVKVSGGIVRS